MNRKISKITTLTLTLLLASNLCAMEGVIEANSPDQPTFLSQLRIADESDFTALHMAAQLGQTCILSDRLKHGRDIEAKDNKGNTPLHIAAESGQTAIAQLLIKHGANVNAKNSDGCTPLDLAYHSNADDIIKLLEKGDRESISNSTPPATCQ